MEISIEETEGRSFKGETDKIEWCSCYTG